MKVGVLALQGAFLEHEKMLQSLGAETAQVRLPADLAGLDALIIPGGESTTIGKLAVQFGLIEPLRDFAREKPTWGTCAGMIFLAKDIGTDRQPLLGLMDIRVNRNAFGRQIDSFETDLPIKGLEGDPFHAVFIRAPVMTHALSSDVEVLAQLPPAADSPHAAARIVAAQQGHWLVTAFHPELTQDSRLHEYFLRFAHA